MVDKWLDLAKKSLETGDNAERTYPGRYEKKGGYLVLSNKKMLFVSEEGLFSKKYNLLLDISYDKIGAVAPMGDYQLELTDLAGKRYDLTFDMNVSNVQRGLEDLMQKVPA